MIPNWSNTEKKTKDKSNKDVDTKEKDTVIKSAERCSRCGSTDHFNLSCIYTYRK